MGAVKLDDGMQHVSSAMEIIDKVISKYEMMLDIIAKAMTDIITQDPVAKEMAKELKEGRAATAFIHSEDKDHVVDALQKAGIKNFKVFDAVHSAEGATLSGIAYSLDDSAKVMSILAQYHATCIDRKNGQPNAYAAIECGSVNGHDFIDYSKNITREIKHGVSRDEAMIMAKVAKETGVPLFIDGPSGDKYTVYFADRDRNEMERVRRETAKIMASPLASKITKTLDWEAKNIKSINDGIISDKDNQIKKGTVIADESGRMMKFDRHNIKVEYPKETFKSSGDLLHRRDLEIHSDGSATLTIRRDMNDAENRAAVTNELLKMKNPVILNPEKAQEYNQIDSVKDKRDYVIDKARSKGRPYLDRDEIEILKHDQEINRLIEEKFSQNNPHQYIKQISALNINQDFWSFKQDEHVNFMSEHDHAQQSYSNPDYEDDARAEDSGMPNADELDKKDQEQIDRAEDDYYSYETKASTVDLANTLNFYDEVENTYSEDHDRGIDYGPSFTYEEQQYDLNDLNNNNIPDEYETPDDDFF